MKYTPLRVIPRIKKDRILVERCDGYFKDIWYTSARYGDVYAPYDQVWTFEGPDRSWRFQHHSLSCVSHLVDGFIATGAKNYLELAKKIIFNWYEVNYPTSPSDMGWHDHSTAWRLVNICRFYDEYQDSFQTNHEEYLLFLKIIEAHCEKLADEEFYMPKHNHGMDQDMALFTGAVMFPSLSLSKKWEELSLKRFNEQLDHLFGEDGSYLEHSPHYVYLLLKNLYGFLDFIYGINHKSVKHLTERLEKSLVYLIYIIRPDGIIPSIGDSENAKISSEVIEKWKINNNVYREFLDQIINHSDIHDDNMPLDKAFMDAGVVTIRNKWTFDEETKQLVIYSGFHSRVHKHYDDLSFTLYDKGTPLITEGGKFNYDYKSEEREYIVSPFAHNSVMVDGKPANIFAKNVEQSGLLSYLLTKNISYVSGMHALYPNVNHRRIFVYFKPDVLIIIDKLDGIKNHIYDTFFNLDPSLHCRREEDRFVGYLKENKTISIKNLYSEGKVESSLIKGETEPLKGWISPNYGELEPNPLLQFRTSGNRARNVYQVTTGDVANRNIDVKVLWKENEIQLQWKSYKMDINLTDFYEHIYIKNKYYKTQKIVKPELFQGITQNEEKQHINA